jgi:hypothetical protein
MLPWDTISYFVCCFIFSLFYHLCVWASQKTYIKCIFPRSMDNKIFIWKLYILGHYHPGLGTRQIQVALMNHNLLKLYKFIDLQLMWPSSPVSSLGNHQTSENMKSSYFHLFPLISWPVWQDVLYPVYLWIEKYLSMQAIFGLLVSLYKKNKMYYLI